MSVYVTTIESASVPATGSGGITVESGDYPGDLRSVHVDLSGADPGVLVLHANTPQTTSESLGTLTSWQVQVYNSDPSNAHTFRVHVLSE